MTETSESTQDHCGNCGIKLRGTGRPSGVISKRFCMAKACQAVKQRQYRAKVRYDQEETPMEDRPCFCCGRELPPRAKRVTDLDVGRWCPAAECQRDRGARVGLFDRAISGEMLETDFLLSARLFFQMRDRGRVDCEVCGRRDAIPHYRHPRGDGEPGMCKELGNFPVDVREIRLAHPPATLDESGQVPAI